VTPEIQKQIDEIWAILRETARRQDRAEKRMDRFEKESGERAEKIDRQLQATARLVAEGIKLVRQNSREIRELQKVQRAFLASFRNGRNGRA
jgi:hypothetical protein